MATKDTVIKYMGIFAPLFISCILLAVQWGSVTTKISSFEDSLRRMIDTAQETDRRQSMAIEKTKDSLNQLQTDMAYIRGKLKSDD